MTNLGNYIQIYSSLPSTNTYAKELLRQGHTQPTVLWALQQTQGRGRQGRRWSSDRSSLTFSLLQVLSPNVPLGILPLAIGLGLVSTLRPVVPNLKVKWPNDLWVDDAKLGGILAETVVYHGTRWLILGVGLNVNQPNIFFGGNPTSFQKLTGRPWPRLAILELALQGIETGFSLLEESEQELTYLFREYGNFLDRPLTIIQGNKRWEGVAKEVLKDGRLLIEDAQGTKALLPDEISVRFS